MQYGSSSAVVYAQESRTSSFFRSSQHFYSLTSGDCTATSLSPQCLFTGGATLIFDVELLEVVDPKAGEGDEDDDLGPDDYPEGDEGDLPDGEGDYSEDKEEL